MPAQQAMQALTSVFESTEVGRCAGHYRRTSWRHHGPRMQPQCEQTDKLNAFTHEQGRQLAVSVLPFF